MAAGFFRHTLSFSLARHGRNRVFWALENEAV